MTGWGLVSELDRKGSDYLQAANVNLLSPVTCHNYKNFREDSQICAGYEHGGTDACAVSSNLRTLPFLLNGCIFDENKINLQLTNPSN